VNTARTLQYPVQYTASKYSCSFIYLPSTILQAII